MRNAEMIEKSIETEENRIKDLDIYIKHLELQYQKLRDVFRLAETDLIRKITSAMSSKKTGEQYIENSKKELKSLTNN